MLIWSMAVCVGYLLLVFAMYGVLVVFAAIESSIRAKQRDAEDFETLESSRFSLPVSVILPVFNEEQVLNGVLDSVFAMNYPELEVVIVDDGSTDGTFELLRERFDLRPKPTFFQRAVPTKHEITVYGSERDPRVRVATQANGGKADALNAGLNLCRYPYVLCLDGDTICREDALLSGMRIVVKDPERVIEVTSQIAIASRPEGNGNGGAEYVDNTVLSNFQHLEYLRTCLNGRLAWSHLCFMFCASGAYTLYRRETLVEAGGFSSDFSCEDIEMTFRLHERHLRARRAYRIVALPEPIVTTEAPDRLRSLVSQRERWQRVTLEVMWHYRRMLLNPRYGVFGLIGMPYFFLSEILAPFFETFALALIVLTVWQSDFSWPVYLVFLGTLSFANALLSASALLLDERSSSTYRLPHVVRLLALSPLELLIYRPVIVWARLLGTWRFFRGYQAWNAFDRNLRPQYP